MTKKNAQSANAADLELVEAGSVPAATYNDDYFERGAQMGISGYTNYSWMPELTLRMAHYMTRHMPLTNDQSVLDFGCAKGYLVHALRILDIDAYGADVSDYALSQVPRGTDKFCYKVDTPSDIAGLGLEVDWLLAKDVLEHLTEHQLADWLTGARPMAKRIFAAIPLGKEDGSGFVVPNYDHDQTHVTVKPKAWWLDLFTRHGFSVERATYTFPGMKENWTKAYPHGNLFLIAVREPAPRHG